LHSTKSSIDPATKLIIQKKYWFLILMLLNTYFWSGNHYQIIPAVDHGRIFINIPVDLHDFVKYYRRLNN